jgi:hypothetical protein
LVDSLREYLDEERARSRELPALRNRIDAAVRPLKQLTMFGLGLSQEAVRVPPGAEAALAWARNEPDLVLVDDEQLRDELSRRRAQEHIAFQISGFLKGRRKEARIRPWKRHELEAWMQQMMREREGRLTGTSNSNSDGAGRPRLKGPKDAA